MHSVKLTIFATCVVLLALSGCSEPPADATTRVERREDVVDFDSLFSLEREYVLRDDPDAPLARPIAMAYWQGNLVFVDQMLAQVRIFDRDGRLVQTIGRPGDGPGEFRLPVSARAHPDGELIVLDPMAGRVSLFARDGTLSDSWVYGEFFMNSLAVAATGELILGGRHLSTRPGGDSAWATLHLFTKTGEHLRSVGYRAPIGSRPFEPNMNQVWVEAVGSTAVAFLIASNRTVFHDLETGREWTAAAGQAFYRPVEWLPSLPDQADFEALREWDAQQMLTFWPVAVDTTAVLARFIGPDPQTGERAVYYDLMTLEGGSRVAVRGSLEQNVGLVRDGRAFSFQMSDSTGSVRVREFSLRLRSGGTVR